MNRVKMFEIKQIIAILLFIITTLPFEDAVNMNGSSPKSWGDIQFVSQNNIYKNEPTNQFIWKVHNFSAILASGQELIFSPKFYSTEDASNKSFRLQLLLVTNTTYQDQSSYLGLFFRIVGGVHDSNLEWPFNYRTVMGIIPHYELDNVTQDGSTLRLDSPRLDASYSNTINPNTDECRLRNAFLRPNSDADNSARTLDGCGNRRQIPLDALEDDRFLRDDTLIVMIEIQGKVDFKEFPVAEMSLRHNDLVSNYIWSVDGFSEHRNKSIDTKRIAVLNSQPFYTHPNGYLIQLYVTILPRRAAFAISFNFAQGDNDRHLQWPFPYDFEVAVIDQNPNYWKRDLIIKVKPSKSDCGSEVFQQPGQLPEFCFLTIQSLQVLSLTNYNFLTNDSLKIRFTTRFERYSQRQRSSVILHKGALVSEFNWLIPGLMSRFERYVHESRSDELASPTGSSSGSKRKAHRFVSDEFYTNGQGYLCQLVLTVTLKNASDFNNPTQVLPASYSEELSTESQTQLSSTETSIPATSPESSSVLSFSEVPSSFSEMSSSSPTATASESISSETIFFSEVPSSTTLPPATESPINSNNSTNKVLISEEQKPSLNTETQQQKPQEKPEIPEIKQEQPIASSQTPSQPILLFGLELVIIEGEFDRFLDWPFSAPYELSIVGYSNLPINGENLYAGISQNSTGFGRLTSSSLVVPSASVESGQCPKEAFQKPIERNPPCGIKKLVQTLPDLNGRASKQAAPEFGTITSKTHEDLHLRVRIRL